MRGIQVGADAYLLKNAFDQSSLVDTVRNLIG
jgi:DNA-binding NarL/FixJ family response regulator